MGSRCGQKEQTRYEDEIREWEAGDRKVVVVDYPLFCLKKHFDGTRKRQTLEHKCTDRACLPCDVKVMSNNFLAFPPLSNPIKHPSRDLNSPPTRYIGTHLLFFIPHNQKTLCCLSSYIREEIIVTPNCCLSISRTYQFLVMCVQVFRAEEMKEEVQGWVQTPTKRIWKADSVSFYSPRIMRDKQPGNSYLTFFLGFPRDIYSFIEHRLSML